MEKKAEKNGKQEAADAAKPTRLKISDKPTPESHREYLDMDTDEEEFGHQETPELLDESPPEPDKPVFTDEQLDSLINHTKDLTVLPNLLESHWNPDCLRFIRDFFCEPAKTILCIFFNKKKLRASLGFPERTDSGLTYFLREPWQIYTPDNFVSTVTFGSVNERTEKVVLKFTDGLYAPLVFQNDGWPEIMRDDIFSNMNDFLTRAIEVTYKPMGILILYVPWEGTHVKPDNRSLELGGESAMRAKSQEEQSLLINRLEKVTRTWIKQIRKALQISPILADELHDVIGEFEFWQSRYENLVCLSKQLKSDQIALIIKQLKSVKSPSISDLKLLVSKVKNALEQAKSNLTFLDMILENYKTLDDPKELQDCLPRILHVIRFVWSESSYYNQPKNIERLLCSLSVHLVKVCVSSIDLQLIFEDPKKCQESLEMSLACCNFYSKIYDRIIQSSMGNEENWIVKKKTVFNCIKSFEQRCQDVFEICDAIRIYDSLNKINLGGPRGNKLEMQYRRVNDYFLQIMEEMRVCSTYALDITKINWFDNILNFRQNVAKVDNTIKNLLNSLFEDVKTVEMGIETLYTLLKFKERQGFQDIIHDKWMQVWEIFYEEIKICTLASMEYELKQDAIKLPQLESSLRQHIYKKYLMRLHKMMINASDWLGDCEVQFEVPSKYLNTKL